jgi:biotin carboxyl carrier protein
VPSDADTKAVRAPIPGVIVSIGVQPGDEVTAGQELCVLEAMKMNNAIRASRAGQVATVYVSVGQHVKHHEVLIEYAD